jgi:hypothetical protein
MIYVILNEDGSRSKVCSEHGTVVPINESFHCGHRSK